MDLSRLRINESPGAGGTPLKAIGITALVAFVLGLAVGLLFRGGSTGPVKVETVVTGSAGGSTGRSFTAGGWIEVPTPRYPVLVSSRISQRLDALLVKHGDTVQPGQVIARLYDGDARARSERARAQAAEADERLRVAGAAYERSKRLEKGVLSEDELDREQAAFVTAREAAAAAHAALDLAEKELSYCTIAAPTNLPPLKVLDVFHTPGEWIALDKNATIASLYDPRNLHMRVDVPQSNIRFVTPGQPVKIRTEALGNRQYEGTVVRIDPLAELAKNTVTVRLEIKDPDDMLFPEMVAHASFLPAEASPTGAAAGAVTVPSQAVLGEGDSRYVFVVDEERARRRPVTVGKTSGGRTTVSKGLASGQRVIVSPLNGLSDGQRVETN